MPSDMMMMMMMHIVAAARLPTTSFDLSDMRRLRVARTRFGIDGLADIHHIIPRQYATRMPADMLHSAENLILMPTNKGVAHLALRAGRIVHDGGHAAYNAHVGLRLKSIAIDDRQAIRRLQRELRDRIRKDDCDLPWR